VYFIAGYFRLHPRFFPRVVIWIVHALVFKLQFRLIHGAEGLLQWMTRHGMGLWGCHFGKALKSPSSTNVVSITLTMSTICSGAGIPLPDELGKPLAFLGSVSFAVYLIHDHQAWNGRIGQWFFRGAEMIKTPDIALMNGYRVTISTFLFCAAIETYRQYLWETLTTIVFAMWNRCEMIHGPRNKSQEPHAPISS
jgi:hypothetical protein